MDDTSAPAHASADPRYYQAADRYDAMLFFWLPVVGGISAFVLGSIYAFLNFLIAEAMESPGWMCIVTPIFAAGLVGTAMWICWLGNVRNRRLRIPIALLVGTLGLYAAWNIYLNLGIGLKFFRILTTWHLPPYLWHFMRLLAADRGASAWLQWLLEAATLYGFVLFLMSNSDPQTPFCEQCKKWTTVTVAFDMGDKPGVLAIDRFTQGQFETLQKLGPRQHSDTHYLHLRVMECPCLASRFVSLDEVTIKRGRKAELKFQSYSSHDSKLFYDPGSFDSEDAKPLVTNLKITAKMRDRLEEIRDKLSKSK